jgi:hypothetical protein
MGTEEYAVNVVQNIEGKKYADNVDVEVDE